MLVCFVILQSLNIALSILMMLFEMITNSFTSEMTFKWRFVCNRKRVSICLAASRSSSSVFILLVFLSSDISKTKKSIFL